jgi:hypothetical protein
VSEVVVVIVGWCDDRKERVDGDDSRVPIYCYAPQPCTRSEDMSTHSINTWLTSKDDDKTSAMPMPCIVFQRP